MEERIAYSTATNLLQRRCEPVTMEREGRLLSTQNLDELQHELTELERRLTPLLNTIRAMQGKKPVFVPKS